MTKNTTLKSLVKSAGLSNEILHLHVPKFPTTRTGCYFVYLLMVYLHVLVSICGGSWFYCVYIILQYVSGSTPFIDTLGLTNKSHHYLLFSDSSDFLPRRSSRRKSTKQSGHRTELGTFKNKPTAWDAEEVAEFLHLQGFSGYADLFQENDIDGSSLFLLKESHLLDQFNMKLGPALRLLDIVSRLRHPPRCSWHLSLTHTWACRQTPYNILMKVLTILWMLPKDHYDLLSTPIYLL